MNRLELHYRSIGSFLVAYAHRLAKGELFLETGSDDGPASFPLATPLKLRVHVAGCEPMELAGTVGWLRPAPIGPGQPAGMGITLISSIDSYGARIDRLASRYRRIKVLVASADATGRAALGRYLMSLITCELVESDGQTRDGLREAGLELALLDCDTLGPALAEIVAELRAAHPRSDGGATAGEDVRHPLPILLLAAGERDRTRVGQLAVDDVLPNPPAFSELQAAVMHALSRPARWTVSSQ